MKLGEMMGCGSETNLLNYGADTDQGADPGIFLDLDERKKSKY